MEQTNGKAAAPVVLELTIQWSPQTGQLGIKWPQVDDVLKMGMLEMAKSVMIEARAQAGMSKPSSLVIPAARMPH
jgi:hypothetical protein